MSKSSQDNLLVTPYNSCMRSEMDPKTSYSPPTDKEMEDGGFEKVVDEKGNVSWDYGPGKDSTAGHDPDYGEDGTTSIPD